jgi:hypothetical protein
MRIEADIEEASSGFAFKPVGPFLLRGYSDDDVDDLKVLCGLLEEILTQHKFLIPGSMNRLMIQWHADLHRAIEAKSENDEGKPPALNPRVAGTVLPNTSAAQHPRAATRDHAPLAPLRRARGHNRTGAPAVFDSLNNDTLRAARDAALLLYDHHRALGLDPLAIKLDTLAVDITVELENRAKPAADATQAGT